VYGDGKNIRDWLYVDDHAKALTLVLERGRPSQTYNVGGRNERTNLQVVESVCDLLDSLERKPQGSRRPLISFVVDRPGHDRRYAIDASKLEHELGWRAEESFDTGLEKTVRWFCDNREWWKALLASGYHNARIGLGAHQGSSR
jgi:dTDP-glucose 4,6-dehydratase